MIRVNLLPREEKAQRRASSGPAFQFKVGDMVLPGIVLGVAAVLIAGTAMGQRSRIATMQKSITDVEAQSRALAPQIARVNQLAQERAELDLRMGVINRLEKGRTQSVKLMDELARCVPDHLWLSGATQDAGTTLTLEGVTFSNLVVSDFMSRLDRSPMFANVELDVAQSATTTDKSVVNFRLTCQVTPDGSAN